MFTDWDVDQIAAIAEILGAATIITGLIFGAFQIRSHRIQQRNAVASSLAKTFYNPEFARAVLQLQKLPDGAPAADVSEGDCKFNDAAVIVSTSFETMGLLVFRKIAPFELVMDMAGGMCVSMHRKLANWIDATRLEQNQPSWAEWFEWLAKLAEERKSNDIFQDPKVRNWRP